MSRQIRIAFIFLLLPVAVFAPAASAQNVQRSEMSHNVHWYGAIPNDGLDDTAAFNAAVAAVVNFGRIYVPRGAYNINNTITVNKTRVHFEGDGPWATMIMFSPQANDVPVFDFNVSPSVNYQSSLRKMSFHSSNTTFKKIAVRLTDVSGFLLEDVAVGPIGQWTGNDSIGVQIRGRDLSQLSRINIAADMPIKIEHNANYTGPLEDLDVWHFNDLTLYAASNRYCITVDDGAQLTDFVMDGSNDFMLGLGGFYWHDTSTTNPWIAYNVTIRNTRSEQLNGGWTVYISTVRSIRHVTLDNVKAGSGEAWKGFRIEHVRYLQLLNSAYYGTDDGFSPNNAVGLELDDVLSVSFLNCFWNTGSIRDMGDLRRIFAINQNLESDTGVFTTEYWEGDANPKVAAGRAMQIGGGTPGATGAYHIGGSGSLANNGTTAIPTAGGPTGGGAKVLYIQIFTNGPGRTEGGTVLLSGTTATKLNGTAGFDVVAGANRIAIDTSGGAGSVVLRNTTGVTMSFGYTIWWI